MMQTSSVATLVLCLTCAQVAHAARRREDVLSRLSSGLKQRATRDPVPGAGLAQGLDTATAAKPSLKCDLVDAACSTAVGQFGGKASSAACYLEDAEIAVACEGMGLGPEDPLA